MNNYNVGIYIRLSKEDNDKSDNKSYSESVENQKDLLIDYVKKNKYNLFDIYIDDGYTGTNFNRPEFNRLISDIELSKVNMVVVKDLSRFGRDYIFTGYYLEMLFPKRNVRFVSILDNIDTFSNNNLEFDFAPFKSMINDMYSRDNSKKIKAALRTKQLQGKWVGGCPPFGYQIDNVDKNHLVINEKESLIVKKIFSLFLSGYSINKISKYLFQKNIPTPNVIRNVNRNLKYPYWSNSTIKSILTNQLYTGDLVQNRRSRVNYKVRNLKKNKKEDWIIVKNTHDQIVKQKDYDDVQRILKLNSNNKSNRKNDYILSGFIYCFECKKRIVIQKNGKYYYTMCNNYRKNSKLNLCTSHSNNYYAIEDIIFDNLKKIINNIDLNLLVYNLSSKLNSDYLKNYDSKINFLKNNIDNLYIDKLNKNIDDEMFSRINNKFNLELHELEENKRKYENINLEKFVSKFIDNIDKKILLRLIKKIELHSDKTIDIYFNFKSLNLSL